MGNGSRSRRQTEQGSTLSAARCTSPGFLCVRLRPPDKVRCWEVFEVCQRIPPSGSQGQVTPKPALRVWLRPSDQVRCWQVSEVLERNSSPEIQGIQKGASAPKTQAPAPATIALIDSKDATRSKTSATVESRGRNSRPTWAVGSSYAGRSAVRYRCATMARSRTGCERPQPWRQTSKRGFRISTTL